LLQRYLCANATGEVGNPEEKRAILQAAINAAQNEEMRDLYNTAYQRWQKSLPQLMVANELQTLGRLIVGLGSENVLETGIRLHHTYGMPILPGSALKGLAAHYCNQVWGDEKNPKFRKPSPEDEKAYRKWLDNQGPDPGDNYHRLLFGTTDDGGCIVFHDAWFVPDSEKDPLKLDVMTPHHPKWLDGSVPPTDFDSPIPVPFLSVAGKFQVAVSWHGPTSDKARNWTQRALECLRDALFHWGVGGKTSSGYGRFDQEKWEDDEARSQREAEQKRIDAEKAAALAVMSPLDRSIKDYLDSHPNKQSPAYMKLLEELKKDNGCWTAAEDRREVANRVKEGMQGAKKWGKKDKDAERTAFIKKILGEL
jgi:CRISPR-associated protein Cmr6